MAKLLTANLTYCGEGEWDCDVKDRNSNGTLCLPGLEEALNMEFDTLNKYQLRIYDKNPRCETTKLYLVSEDINWASDENIVGEDDERYRIDLNLSDMLDDVLNHVEVEVEDPDDEDAEEFKAFYIRVIDKGAVKQVVDNVEFCSYNNELTIFSETGNSTVIKIDELDLSNAEWNPI